MQVTGLTSAEIGHRASAAGVVLFELSPITASLEEAFMALTHDAVEYRAPVSHPAEPGEVASSPERIAA